jgi:hypothetical protein
MSWHRGLAMLSKQAKEAPLANYMYSGGALGLYFKTSTYPLLHGPIVYTYVI